MSRYIIIMSVDDHIILSTSSSSVATVLISVLLCPCPVVISYKHWAIYYNLYSVLTSALQIAYDAFQRNYLVSGSCMTQVVTEL